MFSRKDRKHMEANQIKLLESLAKKIKSQSRDKSAAIASLHAAKILTKNGEFSKNYPNLKRAVPN